MRHTPAQPKHARGLRLAIAAASLALVANVGARADDIMRCGRVLITLGMVAPQVVAKCGEPKEKSVTEVPRRVRGSSGTIGTYGTVRIEHWTYDRGYGQFPGLLTFEDGKLKSIELKTHP